jgi:hypothetical protein
VVYNTYQARRVFPALREVYVRRNEVMALLTVGFVAFFLLGALFGLTYLLVTLTVPDAPEEPAVAFDTPPASQDVEDTRPGRAELASPEVDDGLRRRAEALVRDLGAREYAVRCAAEHELVSLGKAVLPVLREAFEHHDWEIRWRAWEAAKEIERRER